MLKQLRKNILIISLACVFPLINPAFAVDNNLEAIKKTSPEQMKLIQNDVKVNDLDIEPINTRNVKDTVVPDAKQEGKKLMFLFLKTMLYVAMSAVILYFILLFTKKYRNSAFSTQDDDEIFEALDLATPNSRTDALKSFLNRTK